MDTSSLVTKDIADDDLPPAQALHDGTKITKHVIVSDDSIFSDLSLVVPS